MESIVGSELLINIFIPNTPLHDGAVIVRGNQIMAAGCYLPLSENPFISKELGTRHRAASAYGGMRRRFGHRLGGDGAGIAGRREA